MKKLLIAMTAAAVGTCAWAEGGQTLLSESFTGWTLTDNTWWSYSAAAADGELTVTNTAAENAEAEYKLALNTGSKVLTGSFTSDDQPKAIGTDGLYFNATVTFKDPSDTLPELKDSDKFALVVLDNVESIDAGKATTPATNLWVIAKYGESGQRAYQLDVEVTPSWLAEEHKIVVKAYNNVMANGNCAGFLVKVDNENNDTVCEVVQSCAIVEGVIDFNSACAGNFWKDGETLNLGYLGYPKEAILGAIQKRYTDATLILSNVPGSGTLASVDFQGQGVIDNVSLATSGADFGTDSLALTVVADGVTLVDTDTTLYFAEVGDEVTIKFRVNEGYELSSPTGLTPVDGVYTYEYTTTANNEKVTISAFLPKVSVVVGEETLKFGSLAKALESDSVVAGSELKLTAGYTVTEAITLDKNITINLNGQTLTAELADSFEAMFELANNVQLTITDDTENGSVVVTGLARKLVKLLGRAAALAVDAGTFDACVAVDGLTYNITGGKFLATANEGGVTVSNAYKTVMEGDYLKVVAKETFGLTVNKHNGVTITDANGNGLSFNDSYLEGTMLSFKVSYDTGAYQNLSVKVNGNDCAVIDGVYSFTVAAITVLDIQVTAISTGPSIDDTEGDITVDQNTGNATIDTTNATVTVTGTVTGDVIVTPSVGTVNVTLAQGKEVKVYFEGQNISDAFTISSANGTTTIVLNENGSVNGVSVKPEMAAAGDGDEEMKAPLEVGTDVAVGVKTIPGLMYQLIRSDAPNGTFGGVGDAVKGTGAPVKLSDSNKPAGKAFYKVKVSAR